MNLQAIYGIEFDESIPYGGERRICDSTGMENNYVVGNTFIHEGRNDFDQAYPFGEIKICNVMVKNNQKKIIYEDDPGFDRSGASGNVMVRIPKFFSKREKNGTVERWMISGYCHPGFSIEPCFMRGKTELDAVYVGVYNSHKAGNGLYSASQTFPDVCKTIGAFRAEYKKDGLDPYDLAIHICLQKLMMIEFGTRHLKGKLGGMQFINYFHKINEETCIRKVGKNVVTVGGKQRMHLFYPGLEIQFGHKEHDPHVIHRTITGIEWNAKDSTLLDIYYAGDDLYGSLAPGKDGAGGIYQRNGLSDGLLYHTGRCNNHPPCAPDENLDYLINAFRYRYIENVWGNVWEFCSGLMVKDQQYYYTFDPEQYDEDISGWNKLSYQAPVQPYLAEHIPAPDIWTNSMGIDQNEPALPLPVSTSAGTPGNYYDAGFYCYHDVGYDDKPVDPTTLYCVGVGGGYDHYWYGSVFTYRCFLTDKTANWLYSNRVCLRK